jgi:hypothetical protein
MRSVIVAMVFVAAFVAVLCGLRRLRAAPQPVERGPWSRLRATFWLAAAALLGPGACAIDDDVDDGHVREAQQDCYGAPEGEARYEADFDAEADRPGYEYVSCYSGIDDAGFPDYADMNADADADPQAEADDDGDAGIAVDADPDAEAGDEDDVRPEIGPDAAPDGPSIPPIAQTLADPRWERWAVRTELRARTVAALLADPATASVVRDELSQEAARLEHRVAVIKARRQRA